RWALVPADLVFHRAVHALVGLRHQVLADQSRTVGQTIRITRIRGVQQQARCFDRVTRNNDISRALETPPAFAVVVHAGDAAGVVGFDAPDHREIADLRTGANRA